MYVLESHPDWLLMESSLLDSDMHPQSRAKICHLPGSLAQGDLGRNKAVEIIAGAVDGW